VGYKSVPELVARHRKGATFRPEDVQVVSEEQNCWIELRQNPRAFSPSLFKGTWGNPSIHPSLGALRVVHILDSCDGITRVIARQERKLFVKSLEDSVEEEATDDG